MSEQESSKKVIHRLEPKRRPVVSTSIDDAVKLEALGQVAPSVNAHFFGEGPEHTVDVESSWDEVDLNTQSKGRKWLTNSVLSISVLFLGFLVWGLFLSKATVERVTEVIESAEEIQLSHKEKSASRRAVIRDYLSANSLEEKMEYVRDPERVRPLMGKYYEVNPLLAETPSEEHPEEPVMGKSGVLWQVKARQAKPGQTPFLMVETSDDGLSLIDWETDVIYQPSNWEEFIAVRSTRPHTFRVFLQVAQLTGFHGYEFADYTKYRCFKVTIPGRKDYLWAYSEIGSQLDLKLVSLITSGGRRNINTARTVRAMVELEFPEKSQSAMCVSIDALLQAGWFH
ncbi:hypothetical protein [Rubritalea sp.]|uniref:hypothetical protein n=1 Tax=Rubritalea sp. TaxID=2109375 RepID=UPI003EF474F5